MEEEATTASLERYCELALEHSMDHAVIVRTDDVVTEPWVGFKCRYGCPDYGKLLSCPPRIPDYIAMRELLDAYRFGMLLHRHSPAGNNVVGELQERVIELERRLFLDGYYKALAFGCGPCRKCTTCSTSGCVHPGTMRPSMESCGIDVFGTAKKHGLPIHVAGARDDGVDFYSLILIV